MGKFLDNWLGDQGNVVKPMDRVGRVGRDFHSYLREQADPFQEPTSQIQWTFLEHAPEIYLPLTEFHEIPATKYPTVGRRTMRVTGYADSIDGGSIHEYKTTKRSIDWEKYMDSYQWRIYLWLFDDMNRVFYHVFRYKVLEPGPGVERCEIIDCGKMRMNRYDNLEQDVMEAFHAFVGFLDSLRKEGYIDVQDGRIIRGPNRPPN